MALPSPSQLSPAQPSPTCSGPRQQQRLFTSSCSSSRLFPTLERQTLEAALENRTAHQGFCKRTVPPEQTQTQTQTQAPAWSCEHQKRASAPRRAQHHMEPNFPPITSGQAQQRWMGTRKEGRKESSGAEQGAGAAHAHVPSPSASSGTTDSVSLPPPGMMFHES